MNTQKLHGAIKMNMLLNVAGSYAKYKGLHNKKSLAITELFRKKYVELNHLKGGNINLRPDNWKSFYKQLDSFKMKELFIFDSRWSPRMQQEKGFDLNKFYPDKGSLNFQANRMFWSTNMLLLYAIKKGIKVTQMLDDPLGFKLAKTILWFYDYKNMKAFPYAEYGYYFKEKKFYSKHTKFIFAAKDWMKTGRFDNMKLPKGSHISYSNKDFIDYEDYCELVKKAEFTLIVPSFDKQAMSMMRFWEALSYGTVPLIHKDCNWEPAFKNYPKLKSFIPELLVGNDVKIPKVKFSDIPIDSKLNKLSYYQEAVDAYSL